MTYSGLGEYTYSFGDCVPFHIDGANAESAKVNKYAKCFGYSYAHLCSFSALLGLIMLHDAQ